MPNRLWYNNLISIAFGLLVCPSKLPVQHGQWCLKEHHMWCLRHELALPLWSRWTHQWWRYPILRTGWGFELFKFIIPFHLKFWDNNSQLQALDHFFDFSLFFWIIHHFSWWIFSLLIITWSIGHHWNSPTN